MQAFRAFVINTMSLVAFLAYLAIIAGGALYGYQNAELQQLYGLPSAAAAGIGGVVGWLAATIVLGLLFVLIDIRDGIRDVERQGRIKE
ncbi:MAG: hypothetical protein ABWZ40_07025 [Caulobacterales bacterium]